MVSNNYMIDTTIIFLNLVTSGGNICSGPRLNVVEIFQTVHPRKITNGYNSSLAVFPFLMWQESYRFACINLLLGLDIEHSACRVSSIPCGHAFSQGVTACCLTTITGRHAPFLRSCGRI